VIIISDVVVMENRIKVPLSRKPAAITVIDSAMIINSPGLSIADILQNVAGIDMRQRGVNGIQTDASIRGSSFDQVLVLINGVRMSDSQTGHHNFNLPLDPKIIDRIEVFKGPSARVFGQNAFAGAINIITKNPDNNQLNISSFAGSFGLIGGSLSASLNTRTTRNHIILSSQKSDGYKYNTDYSLTNIFYQGELLTGAGSVSYMAGLTDRNFGANGFYSGPSYTEQYEEVTTSIMSVALKPRLKSSSVEMTTRLFWRRNNDHYYLRRNDPEYYHNKHLNNTAGADLNITIFSRAGITGAGIELTNSSINSSRLGYHDRKGLSLFAEHRVSAFNDILSLTPGLQLNHSTGFGTSFLPGIDLGFKISQKIMVYANSGYTYRVPTYTDLYYEDPGNLSNPYLEPELSLAYEVGIKSVLINSVQFQSSIFVRKSSNLIDRIKENEGDKWMPVNVRETIFRGFESNFTLFPRSIPGLDRFIVSRVSAGYLYNNSDIVGTESGYSRFALDNLKNQLILSADLSYCNRLTHTINATYIERVNSKSYTVVDMKFSLNYPGFNFFCEFANLTNAVYSEIWDVTMPGFHFMAGGSYTFNTRKQGR
jgi:iron complex outermembrane receptor protein